MKCPKCGLTELSVLDSRAIQKSNGIRRRRECLNCGTRFTTYEYVSLGQVLVVKRDGNREEFNREKLLRSIQAPCVKRPVARKTIEETAELIEKQISAMGEAEVPSSVIGEAVMTQLLTMDKVAYIRYASIYREFKDVTEFRDEIDSIEEFQSAVSGITGKK